MLNQLLQNLSLIFEEEKKEVEIYQQKIFQLYRAEQNQSLQFDKHSQAKFDKKNDYENQRNRVKRLNGL